MKKSFAVDARTWLAEGAMKVSADFVAVVAPWLAPIEHRLFNPFALVVILLVFAIGLATIGVGGVVAIRELLPVQRHEAQP